MFLVFLRGRLWWCRYWHSQKDERGKTWIKYQFLPGKLERGKGFKYTFLSPLSILLHFFLSLLIADIFKCHECRAEYLFPCRRRRRLTCLRACSYITYQSWRERRQQNMIYRTKDMLCTLNGREGKGANHRRTEREAAGVTFRRGLAYQGRLRGLRLSAFTVAVHKSRVCVLWSG